MRGLLPETEGYEFFDPISTPLGSYLSSRTVGIVDHCG